MIGGEEAIGAPKIRSFGPFTASRKSILDAISYHPSIYFTARGSGLCMYLSSNPFQ